MTKLYYILICTILISCGNSSNKDNLQHYTTGEVINSVACKADNSLSYALYLPKAYTTDKTWPVFFCYDSHGGGATPLNLYKQIAETYGYILIGSNNSANGLQPDAYNYIAANTMNDVKQQFNIDTTHMYALGFSGGARVATNTALQSGEIKGVIACGAGFPQLESAPAVMFNYFGFAGDEDFNYLEITQSDSILKKLTIPHQTITFNGEHAWPNASKMEIAFLWMSASRNPLDVSLQNKAKQFITIGLDSAKKQQNIMLQYSILHYAKSIYTFFNLSNLFESQLTNLNKDQLLIDACNKQQELIKREIQWQGMMQKAFTEKDISWWNDMVINLNKEQNKQLLKVNKRVLNYCSIMAYMASNNALNQKNIAAAERFTDIYTLVDSDNNEAWNLKAKVAMLKKNQNK